MHITGRAEIAVPRRLHECAAIADRGAVFVCVDLITPTDQRHFRRMSHTSPHFVLDAGERAPGNADKPLNSEWMSRPTKDAVRATSARRLADRKAVQTMSSSIATPVMDRSPTLGWAVPSSTAVTTICHPVYQLGRGGLECRLLGLIDGLPEERFLHVLVVRGCTAQQVRMERDRPGNNVCGITDPSTGRDPLWWRRLANIIREQSVDVLHVRGLSMLLDAVLAGWQTSGTRIAFSFHGFERNGRRFSRLRRALYRRAVMRCNARWAVSDAAARSIANELDIDREVFDVLPNGVDPDRFSPTVRRFTIRRALNLSPDRLIVLTVANLKPVKGHQVLLDALAGMRKYTPRITVVAVGGDYLDGEIQARAARQLPDFDIRFVGEQADVLPWMQSADLFVLPSLYEGLSNSLLEAMSCELPCVASNVGGNTEVIDHGESGLLVTPGDPVELASAIQFLLEDADARDSIGAAARRTVLQNHRVDECVRRYGQAYAELAGRGVSNSYIERYTV